jgi:hypothetical protein
MSGVKELDEGFELAKQFFPTYRALLLSPTRFYKSLAESRKHGVILPGAFVLLNLLLAELAGHYFFGGAAPSLHAYPLHLAQLVFGYFLIVGLLRTFGSGVSFWRLVDICCYATVVFVPMEFAEGLLSGVAGPSLMLLSTRWVAGDTLGFLRDIGPAIRSGGFALLPIAACYAWWARLLFVGLRALSPKCSEYADRLRIAGAAAVYVAFIAACPFMAMSYRSARLGRELSEFVEVHRAIISDPPDCLASAKTGHFAVGIN